jgi:hypothetical protein
VAIFFRVALYPSAPLGVVRQAEDDIHLLLF